MTHALAQSLRDIAHGMNATANQATLRDAAKLIDRLLDRERGGLEPMKDQAPEDDEPAPDDLHAALVEIAELKSLTATPTQFYQHLQRIARRTLTAYAMAEREAPEGREGAERAKFEAWADTDSRDLTPEDGESAEDSNGLYYRCDSTNHAFIGWRQARAEGREGDEPVAPQTQEFLLRAMVRNYGDGPHQWDHLDKDACLRAADEIKLLRAALAAAPVAQGAAEPRDEDLVMFVDAPIPEYQPGPPLEWDDAPAAPVAQPQEPTP